MPTSLPVLTNDVDACCTPGVGSVLSAEDAVRLAKMFKALGDPTRVRLLSLIAAHEGGEACICDLTEPVGLSQGTVSHHMKLLGEAGLVSREQRGKWAYYRVERPMLTALSESLRS
jgi:ArsR family transcriptional regulator